MAKQRGGSKGGAKRGGAKGKPTRSSATRPKGNISDPIKGRDTKGSSGSQQGGRTGSFGPLD